MDAKRVAIVILISALLCAVGCHKSQTQSAIATSPDGQPAATQAQDNLPPSAPEGTQSAQGTATNGTDSAAPTSAQNGTVAEEASPAKLIIPAGTPITVRLQQRLSSATAVAGERFEAVIDEPVMVGNQMVLPVGAPVEGHVTIARRSGRLHHPGQLALTLDRVTVDRQIVNLPTARVSARGASHKKRNWGWIGGGSGGGALIGALAAGGKGALIGGGIGAVAGTTTAFITGKKDVTFGNERRLRFQVNQDISLFG
jgi:hypothetical protein